MTAKFILRSQSGDKNATLELIKKFNPLLKKYAFELFYDDAYNDLLVDFVELLKNIKMQNVRSKSESSMVSYISKSIQSSYIKESVAIKKLRHFIPESEFKEEELYALEAASAVNDTYFAYEFPDIKRALTKPEKTVLEMVYLNGYSICETARKLGTSRQAVNQMKNRSLKKLKKQFVDKL